MKFLTMILAGLALATPAFAHAELRCMVSLMQQMPEPAQEHYWLSPGTSFFTFDYTPGTEKVVRLKLSIVDPQDDYKQYYYEETTNDAESVMSIEFSQTDPDGNKYEGETFGFYLRAKTDGLYPMWALGNPEGTGQVRGVDIAANMKGYLILNCIKL